jgi:putative DNA primase/helicase
VKEGVDGRVLLFCHAGCRTDDVVAAIGLSMQDLFADSGRRL